MLNSCPSRESRIINQMWESKGHIVVSFTQVLAPCSFFQPFVFPLLSLYFLSPLFSPITSPAFLFTLSLLFCPQTSNEHSLSPPCVYLLSGLSSVFVLNKVVHHVGFQTLIGSCVVFCNSFCCFTFVIVSEGHIPHVVTQPFWRLLLV